MAKEYVAYGHLGSYAPGDVVNPSGWDEEQWKYMVEHDVVVPRNSPNDPKVLAENASTISGMVGEAVNLNEQSEQTMKEQQALAAHRAAAAKKEAAVASEPKEPTPDQQKVAETPKQATPTAKPATPPAPAVKSAAPAAKPKE